MIDDVHINDCWKLRLHISVLGYYPEGESVLIVLFDSSSQLPLKSILVDCYEKNYCNKLESVFNHFHLKEKKLDYVIWTHPDRDHSIGFKTIADQYTSEDTLYILPEGLNLWEVLNDYEKLKSWLSIVTNKIIGKLNVERVSTSNRRACPLTYVTNYIDNVNDDVSFGIEILTPFANQIFRHLEHNHSHRGNHLSISFVLRFGELGFYFGGDAENMAIKSIDINKLKKLFFVKIPHHGSDTSDELPMILKELKSKNETSDIISITTGYHKGKCDLPLLSVLDLYKECCFKILKTEDSQHCYGYGIWTCCFDRTSSNPWKFYREGDAQIYY